MPTEVNRAFQCELSSMTDNGEDYTTSITINTTDGFDLNDADTLLNKQRVDFTLKVLPKDGEDAAQKQLIPDGRAEARVMNDIGGFRRAGSQICFRISIPGKEMNGHTTRDFSLRHGLFTIHSHEPIPEKVKVSSKPAANQKTFDDHPDVGPRPVRTPGLPLDRDVGAEMPLTELLNYGLTENEVDKLKDFAGKSIGELETKIRDGRLVPSSIPGFGDKKIDKIVSAFTTFRAKYPAPTQEDVDRADREEIGFKRGCEDAVGDNPDADCPFADGSPEAIGWQRGMEETNASEPIDDDGDDADDAYESTAVDPKDLTVGGGTATEATPATAAPVAAPVAAPKKLTLAEKAAYTMGTEAGALGRDVQCPTKLPLNEQAAWREGYASKRSGK